MGVAFDASESPVAEDFGLSDREIEARKAFLELGPRDVETLKALRPLDERAADAFVDALYAHFLAHAGTKAFLAEPGIVERLKKTQKAYFLRLTGGDYGRDYVEDRLRVGAAHERIDLDANLYLGAYAFYLRFVARRVLEAYDREQALELFASYVKIVFFDIGLAIDTYVAHREKTIAAQQEAIRQLATPVLRVRDHLLLVPIVGTVDAARANDCLASVLAAARRERARVVILDVTGVPTVDSGVAHHLVETIQAARLLGARSIVTGISAEIAQTLTRIGVDPARLNAVGELEEGLARANAILDDERSRGANGD